jgi:predicted nucleotidyltransferase
LISVFLPNTKIYLFGSRATGKHRESSDVDIALVDNKQKIHRHTISQIKDAIEAIDMPYGIDVVDLNSVSKILREQIKRDMVLWK